MQVINFIIHNMAMEHLKKEAVAKLWVKKYVHILY